MLFINQQINLQIRICYISYSHYFCWNSLPHFTALQYISLRAYSTSFFLNYLKVKQHLILCCLKHGLFTRNIYTLPVPALQSKETNLVSCWKIGIFSWVWYLSPLPFRKHLIRPPSTMVLAPDTQPGTIYRIAKPVFCLPTCSSSLSWLP